MACNSKSAVFENLRTLGLLQDKRVVPMDKIEEFEQYNKYLKDFAKQHYKLDIEGNFIELEYQAPNTARPYPVYRANPVEPFFEQLDVNKAHFDKIRQTEVKDDFFPFEFLAMPAATSYTNANYVDFISHKQVLLDRVTKKLANMMAHRKFDKNSDVKSDIVKFQKLKEKLELDVYNLMNDPDIFEQTMAVFNTDISLIDELLAAEVPSIENIQLAENMVTYFDIISDYSSGNKFNNFVDVTDPTAIDPKITEVLDKLRIKVTQQKTKIDNAKQAYLLDTIENSEKLKSLFPEQQAEEIKKNLLANKSDISLVSMLFGTIDKQFGWLEEDSMLGQLIRRELETTRSKNKSIAAGLVQQINNLEARVKNKLLAKGYRVSYKTLSSFTAKAVSEVSYDLFYQKTPKGNKTGKLVNKFSSKWFRESTLFFKNFQRNFAEAWQGKQFTEVNKLLVDKYNWLNHNTEFADITAMPEIISNPAFEMFKDAFNPAQAEAYKQEIIRKIGKASYDTLVRQQTEYIEDFIAFMKQEKASLLSHYGVKTLEQMPEEGMHRYNIVLQRNSPFEFMKSHKAGQEGRVDYVIGNSGNQYQSYLKYNAFFPRKAVETVNQMGETSHSDTGYYDPNFDTIEQDADLYAFWEVLSQAAEYMNETLSDADTKLSHNSLLRMKKTMTDVLLDKNNGVMTKVRALLTETKQVMKDLFSANFSKERASDMEQVNKGGISTIEAEVSNRYNTFLLQLSAVSKTVVKSKTQFRMDTSTPEQRELFERATGESFYDFFRDTNAITPTIVLEYLTNQVMDEQMFNLPVMMKAYLDIVSEYKSQKDALPKISIYQSLYNNIKLNKKDSENPKRSVASRILSKKRESSIADLRWAGQMRLEHWVNKEVKGLEDKEYWFKWGRNLNEDEKSYKKAAEDYLKMIEERLQDTSLTDEARENLLMEQMKVQDALEDIGKEYALAVAWNTIVNRLAILRGLGWNIPSQVLNRFQGWYQGMVSDTGKYWTAGNFYVANAFINRKALRRFVPSYRNEVNKTKLLIEKLDIIQDNTNELDRARRKSGFTGFMKKINPFYLTEYVEWHNQTPQILAILMDETIKDNNGISYPVFDGHSFPAHIIKDGEIVLKPEFRTDENIADWEDFASDNVAELKNKMSTTIALLNGDYSRTGSLLIKSKAIGKSVMTFKTWLPNQILLRFGANQSDLTLGLNNYDGAYTGAFKNRKTVVAGATGVGLLAGIAGVTTLGLAGMALPMSVAGIAMYASVKSKRNDPENLETLTQLSQIGQALVKKMIGLPVNTITGKNIVKAHEFGKLGLTPADKQNLMFITNEVTALLWMLLIKCMAKGIMGDDEEKEPKTLDGKRANPYYPGKLRSDREKAFYNTAENMITRLIDDATLYTNPAAMKTVMFQPQGIDSWLKRVEALSDGFKRKAIDDADIMQTGPNAGKSKTWTALGDMFIPGIVNEWSQGETGYYGFRKYAEREWKTGEVIDGLSAFNSDYKLARKEIKAQRAEEKVALTKYWSQEYGLDNVEDPQQKAELEEEVNKLVREELDRYYPLDIREQFDENQNKIE